MSLLKRGARRPISKVALTVFSLAAFQVLAVIGAGTASAVTGCTFNPSNNTINITIDPGQSAGLAVENATADLDAESPPGAILFDNNGAGFENGALSTQCGSATNTLTTSIVVLGSPSADEVFYIDNGVSNGGASFNTAITWAVDLGSNTVGGADIFVLYGSDDLDDTTVLTDTTFTNNGGGGPLLGVELDEVIPGEGDDVVDGSAMVGTILYAFGGPDDDWIAPGACCTVPAPISPEIVTGDAGVDTLSYATRTTSVVIDNATGQAGHSANADCDVVDTGDEFDSIGTFEVLQSGSGSDCLVGNGGVVETFIPGDGDDDITGQAGQDTLDWSSSSAGMVIDPGATTPTATGQGTDSIDGINRYIGSPFDDTLIWDGSTLSFSGGAGVDTVDASALTTGQAINLDTLDPATDDLENVIGGSGGDVLTGNDLRNEITGNDGDDTLFGGEGNDLLSGGLGNDNFNGGGGADTVSFASNTSAGVNVDDVLGFATSSESGDDSFGDVIEIIAGSPFDDTITGGGGLVTINFLFRGGGGDDLLTGSGSNDTLKGGGGDDIVRASNGDDSLLGGAGDDLLVGGPGFDVGKGGKGDDTCKSVEVSKSCGKAKAKALAAARSAAAAKLV